jgi:hypothetical protein
VVSADALAAEERESVEAAHVEPSHRVLEAPSTPSEHHYSVGS